MDLLAERPGRRYSLADAASFVVMRDLGATAALTLDADFGAEGFEIIPARELTPRDGGRSQPPRSASG